jgi:hypothetical protein
MVRRPASNDEREEKAAQVEQGSADQQREYPPSLRQHECADKDNTRQDCVKDGRC